jgi:DNA invertase Pin-like site-specific DNA recombinase
MTQLTAFPSRPPQLTSAHLARSAVIYLRQSSPGQVQYNTGSAARQYSQQDLARAWGWDEERILVVDDDLGVSGVKVGGRQGFAHMLRWINDGQVGAVFTVHEDRLARNLLEFAQLITACEHARVLLVIDGRVTDLHQAGDRLLTVMMGVFAEHENRDRMHKLRSSLLSKITVQKSALGIPPAGYDAPADTTTSYSRRQRWGAQWHQSADPAVVQAITEVFTQFRLLGTVGAVRRALRRQGLRIPCRVMGGPHYGDVVFQLATYARILSVLTNPCYTDAFVYGKTRRTAAPTTAGRPATVTIMARPPEEWVVVRDHHEPHVTWEEFRAIQARIQANATQPTGVPREGAALLGGLLSCRHCGHAMVVGYGRRGGNVPRGFYGCLLREPAGHWYCHHISATTLDSPVTRMVLQTLASLTSQAVQDALAQEHVGHDQQRQVRVQELQRAEATVALAQRRYKAVDPDNTLVARQLERDYEAGLQHLEQLRFAQRHEEQQPVREEGPADVQTLLAIAADVHRVWTHPAVTNVERKELLRALLDRVVFEEPIPGVIELTLQWHGGTVRTVQTYRTTAVKYRILDLWHTGTTVKEIVALLNAEGLCTAQQRPWSETAVEYTLYKYARPTVRWQAVQHRIRELHGQEYAAGRSRSSSMLKACVC